MPKVEIEILRTVTITREENVIVELDVPKRYLEDDVLGWIDTIMEKDVDSLSAKERAVRAAVTDAEWETTDEDESFEYNDANNLSEDS